LLQEISRRLRDFNQRHLSEIIQAERLAALGNFARSIVHDLKTPLTIIGMATEIMAGPKTSLEMRSQSYVRVRRQIISITDLVSDILDYTQNTGRSVAALVPQSYRNFIQSLVSELQAEAEYKTSHLQLENEPPEASLQFDPQRIRRVILNLLRNAVDMMPETGQVILRFYNVGDEVITEIQDTGPGIAPEIADKLFQTFVTYGKAHGTGLGLSICKKIVEDHGGRIYARNAPGHGAIFSFTLPVPRA
jgi:signal transduction histidine kinase